MSIDLHRPVEAFVVGDRVRLRASGAENWIDPKLRLRARKGIPATVKIVVGARLPNRERSYRIEFDAIGRMRPMSEVIHVRELEYAE
jgi:hypothetical protein